MTLELHNLKPAKGSKKKKKRVGRGNSSGHGTYSTRGLKGQRSRSGGKKGLRIKGIKNVIQNIPKKKGFKSIHSKKEVVNVKDLDRVFIDGAVISPKVLHKKGLIANIKAGVKILGDGKLTKKFEISGCDVSRTAKTAINKSGGSIQGVSKKQSRKNNKK